VLVNVAWWTAIVSPEMSLRLITHTVFTVRLFLILHLDSFTVSIANSVELHICQKS
jgi:hypothetical protein